CVTRSSKEPASCCGRWRGASWPARWPSYRRRSRSCKAMLTVTSLRRQVEKIKARLDVPRSAPTLGRLRADPAKIMTLAAMTPDPWQARALCSRSSRQLWLASRQSGKSQTAAAIGLLDALLRPGALVLLVSPTLRQSSELFRAKLKALYDALGRPVAAVQES